MPIQDKLTKCFREGEIGKERHHGLKKIEIDKKKINNYLLKAEHNIKAIISFKRDGFSDWSASASFYALYHCLLAIVSKHGYESRNQKCTFVFIEDLIEKGKIKNITKEDLEEIKDYDFVPGLEKEIELLF